MRLPSGGPSSPFAVRLDQVAIDWLRQLFELPKDFDGVFTSGATMANFVALAAARGWWGKSHWASTSTVDVPAL